MTDRRLTVVANPATRRRFALRDSWCEWRNHLLSSPRFQRWASRNPLTRPIARRNAQTLFDLVAGFVYSQVLLACVQLRLFELLADEPQDAETLERHLGMSPDRTARLLDAAVALKLLEPRSNGRYGLGPQGAVVAGNPGISAMIRHHPMLYDDLRDPLALLRDEMEQTSLGSYWPYAVSQQAADLGSDQVSAYSELMAASQTLIADEVLSTYSLQQHQRLLDVGGGAGAFVAAAAQRWPHLELQLFDLPAVAAQARKRLESLGLGQRVQATGGDFYADELPSGADVISLVRITHDHNDEDVLRLLQSVHRSLPAGGTLLLAEPMAGEKDTDRMAHAYFGFYLLAMGKGRPRTPEQIWELLQAAGFSSYRLLANQMPLQTRIMVAKR